MANNAPKKFVAQSDFVPVPAPAPAFDAAKAFDVTKSFDAVANPAIVETLRAQAEKGVVETRQAYDRAREVAEGATEQLSQSYAAASKGLIEFHAKAIDAMRAETDASFDFVKALIGAKTWSEAIQLQGEHVRARLDRVGAQGKEFSALSQKIAADSFAPLKDALAKADPKAFAFPAFKG